MLQLDGSQGEGGGQVLRTALGLSLVTGQPFAIDKIRAGRDKPGLKRQHLTAVLAAAEIGDAEVDGAELGSQRLTFTPKRVRGGDYRFAVGTAGSTTLVLQTILPALLAADVPSTVLLSGGTHNPMAPSFDFLKQVFVPALGYMGASIELQLMRHGFAPAGGGVMSATIEPGHLKPQHWLEPRGSFLPRARALVANVRPDIAERELAIVQRRLRFSPEQLHVEKVDSPGPGNMLLLEFPGEPTAELIGVPGERNLTAEAVAERACKQAKRYLASTAPVGEHLADQLLVPMAIAGLGAFRTLAPSLHTRTNIDVIERFLPVRFKLREAATGDDDCVIEVAPR